MSRTAFVVGARGQIGRFLLPRLAQAGWQVHALTRRAPPAPAAGLHWHRAGLEAMPERLPPVEVLFALGPLDATATWLDGAALRPARVVAFGSTSAESKQDSPDPAERALAQRLRRSEQRLFDWAGRVGVEATVLRPTLIYGAGLDRNLCRIAILARRWRRLPLPRSATGLRQPVHAGDLADAAWQAALRTGLSQHCYDLPGGETLSYREMVRRVCACLQPPAAVLELPDAPFRAAFALARRLGIARDAGPGLLARLSQDLVFDAAPARRDLDYRPRGFAPEARMFVAPETA